MNLLRFLALSAALLASGICQAAVPELYVDCSFTGPAGDLCKEAVQKWGKDRKVDVHVDRQVITSTEKLAKYTKLLEGKSTKFDVFGLDVIWPGVLHKHLLDLEPFFRDAIREYLPIYVENNTVNGRLLAIPFEFSVGMLLYRQDLLDKYRLPVPQTWQQLTEEASLIQEKERSSGNKDFWGYIFQAKPYEGLTCNALEWIASHKGGSLMDSHGWVLVNTAAVQTALELASSWVGKISPPEVLGFAEKDSHEFFKSGKAAFLRAWPSAWAVVNAKDSALYGKVGVALIPKGTERGIHANALGGWSLAVSKYSRHPRLAADLIRYLTSAEEQKRRTLLGVPAPTLTRLYQDPDIRRSAPYYEILLAGLPQTALRPSRIVRGSYPEMSQEFWSEIHLILEKKHSPLQGMSLLQNKLEELSKRWVRH